MAIKKALRLILSLVAVLVIAGGVLPTAAAQPLDFPIANGHFYKQANGASGAGDTGFAVTDDASIPFWSEFQRLGGVPALGYPISHRFVWEGFTVQAFQKAVLQWQPGLGMFFVNVFDRLGATGFDPWLEVARATPPSFDNSPDQGLSWGAIVARHVALLDFNPAIRAAYFAVASPIERYGLPMSFMDYGNVFVVRAQRAVLQQWKTNTPWAVAGQVVIANGGDITKELGVIPAPAATPSLPPGTSPGTSTVSIFLISLGAGQVGCGDAVVPVTRQIAPTKAPLRAALTELLSIKTSELPGTSLYNVLYQSTLQVQDAVIINGRATVRLVGQIMLGGVCDIPRVEAQLRQTALQFPTVSAVEFFVNGVPLEQVLSLR